jgi:hypothetical protein
MEPLWSPVVATGGKRAQMLSFKKGRKQARTVAVGCDQFRAGPHGKEGVDGSSPYRGLCKSAANRPFLVQLDLLQSERVVGIEPFMELSGFRPVAEGAFFRRYG